MNISEIIIIAAFVIVGLILIGGWIYFYYKEPSKPKSEDIPPSIKEYEPTPLMFLPPEEKLVEKEPLLHSKCPNCGARMTSNTCEYCDMTFYPELDKPSDLISNTQNSCIRITPEGIFIEHLDSDYIMEKWTRANRMFGTTIDRI